MKIHAIQTGTVALTSAWREGVGHGRRRLLHAILDGEWTEPLPIYAFAIEHPEGVIVVDTGEDARASQRSTLHLWVEHERRHSNCRQDIADVSLHDRSGEIRCRAWACARPRDRREHQAERLVPGA
jgi:hypothetical protein